MPLLDNLERKFGRFAMPRIVTVIAGFQVLNWFLIKLVPFFLVKLPFDREAILDGEVWRLFSYVLLPGSPGILWLLCVSFMFMLNDGLEEMWGSFRLNLFILGGVVAVAVGGMIFGFYSTGDVLSLSVLFAFACYFPNQEIMFFFVIPMKIKWLAYLGAGALLVAFITGGGSRWERSEIIFSLLNFAVVFGPGFVRGLRQQSKVAARRRRFENAQPAEDEAMHRCVKCGRTDTLNPYLEFRVNSQGEDICMDCRAQGK